MTVIYGLVRAADLTCVGLGFRFEDVEGLFADPLDAGGEGKSQQVGQSKDGLCVAMVIGGMNVTFDDVIVHQPVDDIGTFAV